MPVIFGQLHSQLGPMSFPQSLSDALVPCARLSGAGEGLKEYPRALGGYQPAGRGCDAAWLGLSSAPVHRWGPKDVSGSDQ